MNEKDWANVLREQSSLGGDQPITIEHIRTEIAVTIKRLQDLLDELDSCQS